MDCWKVSPTNHWNVRTWGMHFFLENAHRKGHLPLNTNFIDLMRFSHVGYFEGTEDWIFYFTSLSLSFSIFLCGNRFLSVSLIEEEGRDLSCIIASLVQVMLDPYFRTITGFQSLIQKEWVMAGYQFLDRCNHLKRSEKEVTESLCLFPVCECDKINLMSSCEEMFHLERDKEAFYNCT